MPIACIIMCKSNNTNLHLRCCCRINTDVLYKIPVLLLLLQIILLYEHIFICIISYLCTTIEDIGTVEVVPIVSLYFNAVRNYTE